MQIVKTKTSDLIPYASNSRTHSEEQVAQIAASIREFGFNNPVLIDKNNGIIAGHGRVMAARKLDLDEVPTVCLDHLNDAQRRAYIIADNKLAENAGWDDETLAAELERLDGEIDLDLLGFSEEELRELLAGLSEPEGLTDEDAVPDVPKNPANVLGDLWTLGDHRLMCGDSTVITEVEKLMDGQRADMVFTDPPYGVNYANKNKALNATDMGNRIQREIKNDHLSLDESFGLWRESFGSFHSVCKDGAAYYVSSPPGGEQMMMMMKALDESGWPVRHTIIWVKNNHVLGRCDYHYKHEPILYGWKEGAGHTWFGGRSQFSVWNVDKPVKSELHPTMKPIELIEIPVMNNTKSGDIVIDLFGGSGSTLIACEKTSRHCRMMELDPIYCDVIITRWQDYTGQTAIHESGKTFAEITLARVKDVA